ncbi:MAG: cysteine rich repeat-containing protein [Pseudomonadota bacterium]
MASARPLRDPGPCSDLKKNRANLSQECISEGRKAKQVAESFWAACKSDVKTLCNDVVAGHGRKIDCLKTHLENAAGKKVSDSCQSWLTERSARKATRGKRG